MINLILYMVITDRVRPIYLKGSLYKLSEKVFGISRN